MGSCLIPSEQKEHYLDLQICPDLIREWLAEGYTHLHFGAIRVVLSSHGRHGLPTAVKMALLNSTFLKYEHAVIGTVLSTLNAGSIVLTFYPNFNVPLKDPNLSTLLKLQIQMTGAEQVSSAYAGTLHHQLVYRLQDHALNLPQTGFSGEPLLITAERQDIPTITQIPKQIAKEELSKLIPLHWFTNYENLHRTTKPLVAMDPTFQTMPDGTVKTSFKEPQKTEESSSTVFNTLMMTPISHLAGDIPVHQFYPDGSFAHVAKVNGHFIWDTDPSMCDPGCDCHLCDDSDYDDYEYSRRSRRKKKNLSSCSTKARRKYHPDDPDSPWTAIKPRAKSPLPIYREALEILRKEKEEKENTPQPCMMFSSYDANFPTLERHVHPTTKVSSRPFVQPKEVLPGGDLKPPSQAEEVLNWHTINSTAQNHLLHKIDSKLDKVSSQTSSMDTKIASLSADVAQMYNDLKSRITELDFDLKNMINQRRSYNPEFDAKLTEITSLKKQLQYIEDDLNRPKQEPFSPSYWSPPQPHHNTFPHFGMVHTLFQHEKPMRTARPRPPERHPAPSKVFQKPSYASTASTSTLPPPAPFIPPEPDPPASQTLAVFPSHQIEDLTSTESDSVGSDPISEQSTDTTSTDSSDDLADVSNLLMANEYTAGSQAQTEPWVEDPDEEFVDSSPSPSQPPPKPSTGPWFSFDKIPPSKWRSHMHELSAWIDNQMTSPGANLEAVLADFTTRFTGSLRDWFKSLNAYRQLQLIRNPSADGILGAIFQEFIGDPQLITTQARKEFFDRRCCSLLRKDLEFHYEKMSPLYYILNGPEEPALKQVYLSSLPEEIHNEIQRAISATHREVKDLSLGQLQQIALSATDKLCEQKKFFTSLVSKSTKFEKACKKSHLQIKCKDKTCDCKPKKASHYKHQKSENYPRRPKKFRRTRFFKRKNHPGRNKSTTCFNCGKEGHYARRCPAKKAVKLLQQFQVAASLPHDADQDDLESLFSEQSQEDEDTSFAVRCSEVFTGYDTDDSFALKAEPAPTLSIQNIPSPSVPVQIITSKYASPITVIAYMDTGAHRTMMNPQILPDEEWIPHTEQFKAADNQVFETKWITRKPIGIKFFPDCITWIKVLGSKLPDKDILIGMDTYVKAQKLRILPYGINHRRQFRPFTDQQKIYALKDSAPPSFQNIQKELIKCCADSHDQFHHPNPLWKNSEFFIHLPFKLNEDINPTKATHAGMSPTDLALARQECEQLLAQGLIEPTSSDWACQAFYVEKRSEQIRGKKRLVIDYKPLNLFLKDDKFPLPRISTLFVQLQEAKIFSKFDLKAGFWQIGVHPDDRSKTAFCIPNAQYQWKVLPFGLKVAPSLFQKAMIRIFQPILSSALVYIDDILLFSKDEEAHHKLLAQFLDIVQAHGIMLSEKKSLLAQAHIDFLGMHFSAGKYVPGPHITAELLKFPDTNLSQKQIQQFLGIVNFIRDFIPRVSEYTSQLSALLKKKATPHIWTDRHTVAVKTLKQITRDPPALKIPGKGQRILQTDASDQYWGAVLLEKDAEGTLHYCGHASGQFKEAEQHYHASYKEILAVKRGIQKFEFHLIGHHFTIQMDNSSFPKALDFKGKLLPNSQLLRLKDWFAKYDFQVQHIKGKDNIIADMLSRPKVIQLIDSTADSLPLIFMAGSSRPSDPSSFPKHLDKSLPPGLSDPKDAAEIKHFAKSHLFYYLFRILHKPGTPQGYTHLFNPEMIFLFPFHLTIQFFDSDYFWFYWCLTTLYTISLGIPVVRVLNFLSDKRNDSTYLWYFLKRYATHSWWKKDFSQLLNHSVLRGRNHDDVVAYYIIHSPYCQGTPHMFWTSPMAVRWDFFYQSISRQEVKPLIAHLCEFNHVPIPQGRVFNTLVNFPLVPGNSPLWVQDPHNPRQFHFNWDRGSSSRQPSPPPIMEIHPHPHQQDSQPPDTQPPDTQPPSDDQDHYYDPMLQDSQDPNELDSEFLPDLSQVEPPTEPWYKNLYGSDIGSDDTDYANFNLSPSQNSL